MFLIIFTIFNLSLFRKSYFECKNTNAYGPTKYLYPLGMFVWGDVFVFSIFWAAISTYCLFFSKFYLFFLTFSLFWVVRSLGETIYWFNQQFSNIKKEPPEKIIFYKFFKDDSVWFINQIAHQCIVIISIIISIYFAYLWINSGFN